jgi:hypothetical protein
MYNGTRLCVLRVSQRVREILAGKSAGNRVFIPQISLALSSTSDSLPFEFRRLISCSISLCHDDQQSTRTESQAQGLCLAEPVFTHCQLYVALSQVTDGRNLRMIVSKVHWCEIVLPIVERLEMIKEVSRINILKRGTCQDVGVIEQM